MDTVPVEDIRTLDTIFIRTVATGRRRGRVTRIWKYGKY